MANAETTFANGMYNIIINGEKYLAEINNNQYNPIIFAQTTIAEADLGLTDKSLCQYEEWTPPKKEEIVFPPIPEIPEVEESEDEEEESSSV